MYGDLCISPVYVYKNTFSGKLRLHEEDEEILGVLSLVFWSLTLIPLLKYIILVLGADDDGEGTLVSVLFFYLTLRSIIYRFDTDFHMRKMAPRMLTNCLGLSAMCCICRWYIRIVLVDVQAFKDGTPEQYKQWMFSGIQ